MIVKKVANFYLSNSEIKFDSFYNIKKTNECITKKMIRIVEVLIVVEERLDADVSIAVAGVEPGNAAVAQAGLLGGAVGGGPALLAVARDAGFFESFRVADDILRQAVQGISDIITIPGIINRDFADVKTIMAGHASVATTGRYRHARPPESSARF